MLEFQLRRVPICGKVGNVVSGAAVGGAADGMPEAAPDDSAWVHAGTQGAG